MADHMHHLSLPVLLAGVSPGRRKRKGGWLVWLSLHGLLFYLPPFPLTCRRVLHEDLDQEEKESK
jgi:hypothetical protein